MNCGVPRTWPSPLSWGAPVLTEGRTKERYFQNPACGYGVLERVIKRLLENQQLTQPAGAPAESKQDKRREYSGDLAASKQSARNEAALTMRE